MPIITIKRRYIPGSEECDGRVIWEGEARSVRTAILLIIGQGANLSRANLSRANLSYANLSYANLSDANLSYANLSRAKADYFKVLDAAPNEVPWLLAALRDGRVDGSVYEGECACLIGTIANIQGVTYKSIPGLVPDPLRPAERWFTGILEGPNSREQPGRQDHG